MRKVRAPRQSSLWNAEGKMTSSEEKADTMAEYLESVQWRVRPAGCVVGFSLGPTLAVNRESFTTDEVREACTR